MTLTALMRCSAAALALAGLAACAPLTQTPASDALAERLQALPDSQVLLLGEQHDAPEHQLAQQRIVAHLAGRGRLAALVLEMAPRGGSTAGLTPSADEAAVRQALRWDDRAWPWAAYGPAVMHAVRAGVPVLGGNLPMDKVRESMGQPQLDEQLPPDVLRRQQALVREGHCGLLPERQIAPMTRVQIARDLSMAQALQSALAQARTGQSVVLISGSVHADRQLGVPRHLPAGISLSALRLAAGGKRLPDESFDLFWPTPATPVVDHCAGLAEHFKQQAPAAR